MFSTLVDSLMGYCDACGHYGYLDSDIHMHAECILVIDRMHDEDPAPLTDGDEHMIVNHYRGLG
jgi:hypothetical protein